MEYRFINRYRSFEHSLEQLMLSRDADLENPFVLPGTVQNFNLTFDLSWKVMKEILLEYYGVTDFAMGSPRQVLRKAFELEIIDNDRWLQMLEVRNKLAHDYDGAIAKKFFFDIVSNYTKLFKDFSGFVQKLLGTVHN